MNSGLGIVFGLLASLAMALMSVLIHFTSERYTLGDIVFFRSLFMMLWTLPFAMKHLPRLLQKDSLYLWIRSLIAGVSMITYMKTLQLGHVALANSMAALTQVFVAILAYAVLKERLQRWQIFGLILVTAAVVFIQSGGITKPVPTVIGMGLAASVFASVSFVLLRRISGEFPLSLIVFTLAFFSFSMSFTLEQKLAFSDLSFQESPLAGICVSALFMQLFVTLSFRRLKAGQAIVLNECFIIFSGIFSAQFTGIMMGRTEWSMYLVIIFGIALVNLPQKRLKTGLL